MSQAIYTGVNNVARKVKTIYVGVNGVARKVRKAYIGVAGKARLFYLGYIVAKKLSVSLTPWSDYYGYGIPCGTSIGKYAVFAAYEASNTSGGSNTVLAFSDTLTRSTPATLSVRQSNLFAEHTSKHGLFLGPNNSSSIFNAFNTSFTRTDLTLPQSGWGNMGTALLADKALFAGGKSYPDNKLDVVYAYDTSLTRTQLTSLSSKRFGIHSAANDSYAVFAGGYDSAASDVVEAFNTSFTKVAAPVLGKAYYEWMSIKATAAGMKEHVLLFPRVDDDEFAGEVYAYDTSLTRTLAPSRYYTGTMPWAADPFAVSINNTILVGGSSTHSVSTSNYDNYDGAELYDDSLTRTVVDVFTHGRSRIFGAAAGDYVIFGGGANPNHQDWSQTMEVYEVS